jgi:hypothetical protein
LARRKSEVGRRKAAGGLAGVWRLASGVCEPKARRWLTLRLAGGRFGGWLVGVWFTARPNSLRRFKSRGLM